ncbi:hypothetical protein TEU_07185 [Thermococcus eurythermalis]|uniref:Uncharacterized protein n=1 Tax=Thermococcus eurythermalis TaxID=1505907 RepID=A0A097QUH4_9EURY|nr:hypothetical protein [Thermococcus eurythermalis]AIU70130.1 hypothetical protein TEU_07185 [Thermococcus eurythermalis]
METIEAIFYIEGLSNDRKALESAMAQTVERLKSEKEAKVKDIRVEDILEDPENELMRYSGMIEARIEAPFDVMADLAIRYAPAAIEVLTTSKVELEAEKLTKILGGVSYLMSQLIDRFGALAAYPQLDELEEPKIGYSREEIESMILEDRMVLYRFVVETFSKDEETLKRDFSKALAYEGCRINKFIYKEQGTSEKTGLKYFLVATELISDVETLFQLTAKYSPVAIEVVEPEIVDITPAEIQGVLSDLAGFSYELVSRPLKAKVLEKENTSFRLMR